MHLSTVAPPSEISLLGTAPYSQNYRGDPLDALKFYKPMSEEQPNPSNFPLGNLYLASKAGWALLHDKQMERSLLVEARALRYLLRHRLSDWGQTPPNYVSLNEQARAMGSGRIVSCYLIDTRLTPYFEGDSTTPLFILTDFEHHLTVLFMPRDLKPSV